MKNKVIRVLAYILGVIPLLVLGGVYTRLPEEVPVHWGFNGNVEYGAKNQLWLLFALGLIFAIMFDFLPKIDPKRENYQKFGKYYDLFAIAMIIFLDIVEAIVLIECFVPNTIPVGKVIITLISIIFMITGNLMPKVKTNFYMGIKTPWTLSNSDVWNKTHRLGGRIMFIVGVVSILSGLFMPEMISLIVLLVGVACIALIPLIMSYVWYRQLQNK